MRRSRRGVPGGLAREAFGASAIAVTLVLTAGWWYLADRSLSLPDIALGVAAASSPPETIVVTTGPSVACVSLRSASGTLVMVKIPHEKALGTYEYGARIPVVCDDRPLPRPYYGASSAIERTVSR